ncbi:MAG: hypothetical protein AAGC74_10940 [Verrucomicrobiota bacterium]
METRWTARVILAFLTLEVGLLCNLYTPQVGFLRDMEEGLFRMMLSWVRDTEEGEVLLEKSVDGRDWELRPLERVEERGAEWSLVEMGRSAELFDGVEPSPTEMAWLLSKLHQGGTRALAFTRPLAWEEAPELDLRTLDLALRPFDEVLLPLGVSEVPNPRELPEWLEGSTMGSEQVRGDFTSLPLMNSITVSPSVTPDEDLGFAFPDFGARDPLFRSESGVPLVARWGERLIPSWSLSLAMRLEGVEMSEVMVEPGRQIRLGKDGPVIPIDDFGRAILGGRRGDLPETVSATALAPFNGKTPELGERVVLMDGVYESSRRQGERMLGEAMALTQLPRPGKAELFERLPLRWELMLYLEVILIAIFALYVRPTSQVMAFGMVLLGLLGMLVGLVHLRTMWTPVLPILLSVVVAWCLAGYLQQVAHPAGKRRKEEELSVDGLVTD